MVSEDLRSAVEVLEPKLQALARNLGQTPGALLGGLVDEKEKAWALAKLDEAVAEAKASGFTPHIPGSLVTEVRNRAGQETGQSNG